MEFINNVLISNCNKKIEENAPLARYLMGIVESYDEIPPELYQPVAEVFSHIVNEDMNQQGNNTP